MKKKNNKFNYLLILCLWHLCLQGHAWALEIVEEDKLCNKRTHSTEEEPSSFNKKPRNEIDTLATLKILYNPTPPLENPLLLSKILSFLVEKNTHNFLAVAKFYNMGMELYKKKNEKYHHFPWNGKSINARLLCVFNTEIRTFLGLFVNIKLNQAFEEDRIRFERLYRKLMQAPFFTKDDLPLQYVRLLHLDLAVKKPTQYQFFLLTDLSPQLDEIKRTCSEKLSGVASQENPRLLQNETALYFHFIRFVREVQPSEFGPMTRLTSRYPSGELIVFGALWIGLKSSLMDVMNERLHKLKKTPNLATNLDLAETWREIIALEPAKTRWQRKHAVDSFCKTNNHQLLAEYMEEEIGICELEDNFSNLCEAYYTAANANFMIGNYGRAAKYFDIHIQKSYDEGGIALMEDVDRALSIFERVSNRAQRIEYARRLARRLLNIVSDPDEQSSADYEYVAKTLSMAEDPVKAALYYEKAGECCEGELKDINNPLGEHTSIEPSSPLHYSATHYFFKAANYGKTIEHGEKYIQTAQNEKTKIEQDIYDLLTEAHTKMGSVEQPQQYFGLAPLSNRGKHRG